MHLRHLENGLMKLFIDNTAVITNITLFDEKTRDHVITAYGHFFELWKIFTKIEILRT